MLIGWVSRKFSIFGSMAKVLPASEYHCLYLTRTLIGKLNYMNPPRTDNWQQISTQQNRMHNSQDILQTVRCRYNFDRYNTILTTAREQCTRRVLFASTAATGVCRRGWLRAHLFDVPLLTGSGTVQGSPLVSARGSLFPENLDRNVSLM